MPQQAPSSKSLELAEYYHRLQANLLRQGLLREDIGEVDAPLTAAALARNFINIALYDEYPPETDMQVVAPQESVLRRWEQPIRMQLVFGASLSAERAAQDRAEIEAYAARLSQLAGVPITQVEEGGNFLVAVLSEDERRTFAPQLRDAVPGISEASVRNFTNVPFPVLCLVLAFGSGQGSGYSQAIALIRAEHPAILRTACIHEELAQGMGLANDSPVARPSIFNDSEEFAQLTRHDELLLRILYDPRLQTGMRVEEATPLVQRIAAELVSGGPF